MAAGAAFAERSYSAQDGARLYYRDYGDPLSSRLPMLCLSGLTRNSNDFDRLARTRARYWRGVCPDFRGRGRSAYDTDWRKYAPRVTLSDVRHLMIAADLHRAVICGVSFGGLLAMALGALAPTAIAGAILNDVGPDVSADGKERILDYIGRDHPQPDWPTAIAAMRTMFPLLSHKTDEDWRLFTEATFREGDDGQLHVDYDTNLVRPMRDSHEVEDCWRLFGTLRHCPVLALRGGESDVLSAETLAKMARVKPDLRQLTLPGVGHTPSMSEPESEHAIDEFLHDLDG